MKQTLAIVCLGGGAYLISCGGESRTTIIPPGTTAGAGGGGSSVGGSSSGAAGSAAGGSGAGGAAPVPMDAGAGGPNASGAGGFAGAGGLGAGGLAGAAGVGVPDGGLDPGGPITITIDPESIVMFSLPIGSTRFAAAGFDSATGICASIIWDYSNNDLELERHCDDFETYPDFPYILVREPPESCDNLEAFWDYAGLEPWAATGCIDPLEDTVNVAVEVFAVPTFYRILMDNEP